jgi:hypothetical protein
MNNLKKQERIIIYAANGFRIIINKYSDPANIELFKRVVIDPKIK